MVKFVLVLQQENFMFVVAQENIPIKISVAKISRLQFARLPKSGYETQFPLN